MYVRIVYIHQSFSVRSSVWIRSDQRLLKHFYEREQGKDAAVDAAHCALEVNCDAGRNVDRFGIQLRGFLTCHRVVVDLSVAVLELARIAHYQLTFEVVFASAFFI